MLRIIPCSRQQALDFISMHHRHHKPPVGDVFRMAAVDGDGAVVGVLTCGRPVARALDDGWALEVTRVATDGTRNACSLLYGAARRAAWAMGYRRIYTYTLPEEGGASLRAAGWVEDGCPRRDGKGWSSRPGRADDSPAQKTRWHCDNPDAWSGDVAWPDGSNGSRQVKLFATGDGR